MRPIAEGETEDYTQTDEEDMGMSYKELGIFGYLRKVRKEHSKERYLKFLRLFCSFKVDMNDMCVVRQCACTCISSHQCHILLSKILKSLYFRAGESVRTGDDVS